VLLIYFSGRLTSPAVVLTLSTDVRICWNQYNVVPAERS